MIVTCFRCSLTRDELNVHKDKDIDIARRQFQGIQKSFANQVREDRFVKGYRESRDNNKSCQSHESEYSRSRRYVEILKLFS